MRPRVNIVVDGATVQATAGDTLAATLANAGMPSLRRSITGENRGPLCGMGVCQECRVIVDGVAHSRACMVEVREGMRVERPGVA